MGVDAGQVLGMEDASRQGPNPTKKVPSCEQENTLYNSFSEYGDFRKRDGKKDSYITGQDDRGGN